MRPRRRQSASLLVGGGVDVDDEGLPLARARAGLLLAEEAVQLDLDPLAAVLRVRLDLLQGARLDGVGDRFEDLVGDEVLAGHRGLQGGGIIDLEPFLVHGDLGWAARRRRQGPRAGRGLLIGGR